MTTLAILALFASAASAGNLIEIASVAEKAVPGTREMTHTYPDHTEVIHIMKPPLITTEDVAEISLGDDPMVVRVKLSIDGAKKFTTATTGMGGKRIAIIVQGRIMNAPVINNAPLGGLFEISGFKNAAEAKVFVDAFNKKRG